MEEKVNKLISWYSKKNSFQSHIIEEDAKKIIDLGIEAVPYLMNKMLKNKDIHIDHWMLIWVVIHLTNENPIKENHQGNLKEILKDFKKWWRVTKNV
jgi:hypothetical protein